VKRYRAIADYYDAENADSKMLQQDVPFFLGQLQRRRLSVLELCVGTGRAAIPIAQAGHRVVGVDYASDLLAIAKRKRDAVGLGERELELIKADALSLNLDRRFDWVCIFFNTLLAFVTLDEQDRLLGVVRRHLKPGGRLWLDLFQPDLQLLSGPRLKDLEARQFYVPALDRSVYHTTEIRRRDLARQVQEVIFHYSWFDPRGRQRRKQMRFEMTWIFPRELQLLLERNGLRIERMYGNYDGGALQSNSPRIISRCVAAS
jgi:ubiquinone/menaquinone biosynthesis C-methylase UbiE